jgi:nucleoside-diphosphate-sugar epimerase
MEGLVARAAAGFKDLPVLITGAAGFIGRRLTQALEYAGADVIGVDASFSDSLSSGQHIVDIRDADSLTHIVRSSWPAYVFHLAAIGVTDPFLPLKDVLAVNLQGSINLFQACFSTPHTENPICLVNTGTPYEYGNGTGKQVCPINPYAASKAAAFAVAQMLYRTEGYPIVTVRPFQVYGPGQSIRALIPSALKAIHTGEPFLMTQGEQCRDFIYIDDIVSGYLLAAKQGIAGKSYDLGWGCTHSIKKAINMLFDICQTPMKPIFGALPYRPGEIWDMCANNRDANQDLDWSPGVPLDRGLALTAECFVKSYELQG